MKIKKILLVWPYIEQVKIEDERLQQNSVHARFPLGIAYVAAYLEKYGYQVEVLDLMAEKNMVQDVGDRYRIGLLDHEIEEHFKKINADVIGISQMFSYLHDVSKNIFRIAKKVNKNIITVWGGNHPTVMPKECLSFPLTDYVIIGEGEKPIRILLDRLNANESLEGMNSLGFKDSSGNLIISKERYWIEDLNTHVLPAREKFEMDRYSKMPMTGISHSENLKMVNLITSRGCPFACTFCTAPTFYQKRFLGRSPKNVVDEMESLVKEYGANTIIVDDENLTNDMKRIEAIMDEMIARKLKINWYAEVGLTISKLNLQILTKMKKTGYIELRLALESGDAEMLRKMKKPLSLRKAIEVAKIARETGIRMVSFLLIGMPGESLEQMENTVNFAYEVGFDWNIISMVLPLPGTKIREDLDMHGFEIQFEQLERYTKPIPGVSEIPSEKLIEFRENANNYLNFENNFNLNRGDPEFAARDFGNLLKRYPNLSKLWYYYGVANHKCGRDSEALQAFQKASEINGDFKDVKSWIHNLTPRNYRATQVA